MAKISVLTERCRRRTFTAYCQEKGFKKSTLTSRLIREHLDREGYASQRQLALRRMLDRRGGQQSEGPQGGGEENDGWDGIRSYDGASRCWGQLGLRRCTPAFPERHPPIPGEVHPRDPSETHRGLSSGGWSRVAGPLLRERHHPLRSPEGGLPSIGIDLNPIAVMMSRVKTAPIPEKVGRALSEVVELARTDIAPVLPDIHGSIIGFDPRCKWRSQASPQPLENGAAPRGTSSV